LETSIDQRRSARTIRTGSYLRGVEDSKSPRLRELRAVILQSEDRPPCVLTVAGIPQEEELRFLGFRGPERRSLGFSPVLRGF
jgi:hypothetical protein